MAGEKLDGKVAIRLFFLIVGTLFIWNSIPSHRWTQGVSANIETGMWTTCSCSENTLKDCKERYTTLEHSWFLAQAGGKQNKKEAQDLQKQTEGWKFLFHDKVKSGPGFNRPDNDPTTVKKDSQRCNQYAGTGAIALISYIFGFFSVLVMVKNISKNQVPVVDGTVMGLIVMSGIWGLIATVLFADLYSHEPHYPLGYHFGLFTFAWICFIIVGGPGLKAKEGLSQGTAAILVVALTAFAFSMGNNWYVHDNQTFVVPEGGRNWTIKNGNYFISEGHFSDVGSDREALEIAFPHWTICERCNSTLASFPHGIAGASACDNTYSDTTCDNLSCANGFEKVGEGSSISCVNGEWLAPSWTCETTASQSQSQSESSNTTTITRRSADADAMERKGSGKTADQPHKLECIDEPTLKQVTGFKEVGLWRTCYCKNTLGMECTLFGSYDIMFQGSQHKCDRFNVARACVLISGIFSLGSLVLASALIGGLRKVSLHVTSNTLAFLSAFIGFIASVLIGAVLYDVKDLGRDYAIFLAGWWLVFMAGCLGGPVTAYYRESENLGKVTPMVPITQV